MNKPLLVISAPIFTRSGYGSHSRDILKAIRKLDKFDIKILSQRWGNTPFTALKGDDEFAVWCRENTVQTQLSKKPDVFVQISVANEFQPVGEFNIGITAGVETDLAPHSFVEGCNRMDLIVVPSHFVKSVLEKTTYTETNKQTGQAIREIKITKPIVVLFEGVDESIYSKGFGHNDILKDVETDFNFLFVGHWLQGAPGEDRKDIYTLIDVFCTTFGNQPKEKQPGLILKTSSATFSVMDREAMVEKIKWVTNRLKSVPPIYLLHGDMSDEEISSLYYDDKVKVMASLTKGEGYGRPLAEFTFTGKPIIASKWSGHMDFLSEDGSLLVDGEVKPIHQSVVNDFLIKESKWFTANASDACAKMFDVWKNYDKHLTNSKKLQQRNKKEFSLSQMDVELKEIFDTYVKVKEYKQIVLPELVKL
jgi:glycosyltransferase involved in cell wall biosynthesis